MSGPVILDNDWSGDPDGLVALAHHLLHPGNEVVAVTSTFLHPMFGSPQSRAADGARLAAELVDIVGGPAPMVAAGAEAPLLADASAPISQAGRAIVEIAGDAGATVTIACGGPLTNVAQALQAAPEIAARLHVVWVGGSIDSLAAEYNRDTDSTAAATVFATPGLRVTQFSVEAYRRNEVQRSWLEQQLLARGSVGTWLWRQFADLYLPDFLELGPTWALGDSLPLLVTAMDEASCVFEPSGNDHAATVRVCTDYSPKLLVDDLMSRLAAAAERS